MVFFNYSTMQMAAKVVYYGPGLCGKTTNLQHIYSHTSSRSRGEMVSLETETDRTLFFDLLPLEVGKIQGFKTRIQLYTVPGQVFYNTTRKLVLKGVDGIVFVADSQRAMEQANIESLANLAANLDEIGLTFDDVPIVLQYNKRDLANIIPFPEMERGLNGKGWPSFEASALTGEGVFDTLRGISKLTLVGLKKRLLESAKSVQTTTPKPATPLQAQPPISEPTVDVIDEPATQPATEPGEQREPTPKPQLGVAAGNRRGGIDILAELEKIRQQARAKNSGGGEPAPKPVVDTSAAASSADTSSSDMRASDLKAGEGAPQLLVNEDDQDPSGAFDVADFVAAAEAQDRTTLQHDALVQESDGAPDRNKVEVTPLDTAAPAATEAPTGHADQLLNQVDDDGEFELEPIANSGLVDTEFRTTAAIPDHVSGNGHRELEHSFKFHPTVETLERATRLSFRLRIEDADRAVVDTFDEAIQVDDAESIKQLLLKLRIALDPSGVGVTETEE